MKKLGRTSSKANRASVEKGVGLYRERSESQKAYYPEVRLSPLFGMGRPKEGSTGRESDKKPGAR